MSLRCGRPVGRGALWLCPALLFSLAAPAARGTGARGGPVGSAAFASSSVAGRAGLVRTSRGGLGAAGAAGRLAGRPLRQARQEAAPASRRIELRELMRFVSDYHADDREAWRCLALTAVLWSSALYVMHVSGGHWASVLFMALCILRVFIVFHDACHLSFFQDTSSNRALAWASQFFASYSSDRWDEVHNPHHAHFGKAEMKDTAETVFYSEAELSASPWYFQVFHRVMRDPFVYFSLGGLWIYWFGNPPRHLAVRVQIPLLIWLLLGRATLWGYFWAGTIAGAIGVALFHLQHFCNTPYRIPTEQRTSLDAALLGSTRMPLPWPVSVFTLGIEYHHIHHLDIRVPGYRLERCDAHGQARGLWSRANTIDFWRGLKSMFHTKFAGSVKSNDSSGAQPRFITCWPYSVLGLQDV